MADAPPPPAPPPVRVQVTDEDRGLVWTAEGATRARDSSFRSRPPNSTTFRSADASLTRCPLPRVLPAPHAAQNHRGPGRRSPRVPPAGCRARPPPAALPRGGHAVPGSRLGGCVFRGHRRGARGAVPKTARGLYEREREEAPSREGLGREARVAAREKAAENKERPRKRRAVDRGASNAEQTRRHAVRPRARRRRRRRKSNKRVALVVSANGFPTPAVRGVRAHARAGRDFNVGSQVRGGVPGVPGGPGGVPRGVHRARHGRRRRR